jgi:hypothetical protein
MQQHQRRAVAVAAERDGGIIEARIRRGHGGRSGSAIKALDGAPNAYSAASTRVRVFTAAS